MNYVVPLPVLLPLFGCGAALMFSRRPRVQRAITVSVLVAVVAIASMLLVAADQEGGEVQQLTGQGFSTIPSGREQGAMDADELEQQAGPGTGEKVEAPVFWATIQKHKKNA